MVKFGKKQKKLPKLCFHCAKRAKSTRKLYFSGRLSYVEKNVCKKHSIIEDKLSADERREVFMKGRR